MKLTVKNAKVITRKGGNYSNGYDWVDYSFDGDYEYASVSGDDYEYAVGKKKEQKKSTSSDKPAKKTFKEKRQGFAKKVGNVANKVSKAFKNFVGKLKAKKAARKLKKSKGKDGKPVYTDLIPPVVPAKINGGRDDGFSRANPDGSRTEFTKAEVEKAENGKVYASEDLRKEGKNTIDNGELVKIIPNEVVKELTTEDGETIPFHQDDVIDKDAPDDGGKGMNPTTKKILIGSAIAVGLGLVIFTVYKLTKTKK
jgi:hypothetical protein